MRKDNHDAVKLVEIEVGELTMNSEVKLEMKATVH